MPDGGQRKALIERYTARSVVLGLCLVWGVGIDAHAGGDCESDQGCEALAHLVIHVVDAEGKRIPNALVSVDGLPAGRTDKQGTFAWPDRPAGSVLSVGVQPSAMTDTTVLPVRLVPGEQEHEVRLPTVVALALAKLSVRVMGPGGLPVGGAQVFAGDQAVGRTGSDGRLWLEERLPGDRVVLSARAPEAWLLDSEPTTVDLVEGDQERILLLDRSAAAASLPPELIVFATSPDGQPLPRAVVTVDGLEKGKTDDDGRLVYTGRPSGTTLVVAVQAIVDEQVLKVVQSATLIGGPQALRMVVDPSLAVAEPVAVAEGSAPAGGATAGGVSAGSGASAGGAAAVAGGAAVVAASAPQRSELAIWVMDDDGGPIEGARVVLTGAPSGTTGPDGAYRVSDLAPGTRVSATVTADWRQPASLEALTLEPGKGSRTLVMAALDSDGDGLVDRDDACREEAEAINGYRDDDGCADALATLSVQVVSSDGATVHGATVTLGDAQVGTTNGDGRVLVVDLMPGEQALVAVTGADDTHEPGRLDPFALVEGPQAVTVVLARVPEPEAPPVLTMMAVDDSGAVVQGAEVWVDGSLAGTTDAQGHLEVTGRAVGDRLSVRVVHPEDAQAREPVAITLVPGPQTTVATVALPPTVTDADGDGIVDVFDACPAEPETVNGYKEDDGCPDSLAHVSLTVHGPSGAPVEGAVLMRGDAPLGKTAAGVLTLADHQPGTAKWMVTVPGTDFEPQPVELSLAQGAQAHSVSLTRRDTDGDGLYDGDDTCVDRPETANGYLDEDGCPDKLSSVFVEVTDPEGKALVGAVISGPEGELARTDSAGSARLPDRVPGEALSLSVSMPGTDRVAVELPALTLVEGAVRTRATLARADADGDALADADDACPTEAEVQNGFEDTDGCPDALAAMVVTVHSADGRPVEGALVATGDGSQERTNASGVARLGDLLPGAVVTLSVSHASQPLLPGKSEAISLVQGEQQARIDLQWRDTDGDGLVDPQDACLDEAETLNGHADTDGCPDSLATLTFAVTGHKGALAGAAFVVGGVARGKTDARGELVLADLPPETELSGTFEAQGYESAPYKAALAEGRQQAAVALRPLDRDHDGIVDLDDACPTEAETKNDHEDDDGCADEAPAAVAAGGVAGAAAVGVAAGAAVVAAAEPDRDGDGLADLKDECPEQAEVANGYRDDDGCPDALAHLTIEVFDAAGPIGGATVDLRDLGQHTTADDGTLALADLLPRQTVFVAVASPYYGEVTDFVKLDEGEQRHRITLSLTDTDSDGLVDRDDACVEAPEVQNGHADTDGCPDALADLTVQVVDDSGAAVVGASVVLGGKAAGTTAADGTLVLSGLLPTGTAELSVQGQHWAPGAASVTLGEGATQHLVTLPLLDSDGDGLVDRDDACPTEAEVDNGYLDEDGCADALASVTLTVTGEGGKPLAGAQVRADGTVVGRTGADGTLLLADRVPGATLALALSAEGYEPGTSQVTVGEKASVASVALTPADLDGDGFVGAADACPAEAETQNGHEDDDGCPDRAPEPVVAVAAGAAAAGAAVASVAGGATPAGGTAADDARRAAEAEAAEQARLAEAKAAEEARLAEAKAAEEARLAEAKAAEETRLAAEAKAAEEARLAEVKATEEARLAAEAKAAEEARLAAEAKAAEQARLQAEAAEQARLAAEAAAAEEARLAAEAAAIAAAALLADDDSDGLPAQDDACPTEPETKNGYKDDDGCPDALATVRFEVKGPGGRPVAGAVIRAGGKDLATTGADGIARVTDRMPGEVFLAEVVAPEALSLMPQRTESKPFAEGEVAQPVQLESAPKGVRVVAVDEAGVPQQGKIILIGDVSKYEGDGERVLDITTRTLVVELELGADGEHFFALPPGPWTFVLECSGFLRENREVTVTAESGMQDVQVHLRARRGPTPPQN